MTVVWISHAASEGHVTPEGHPERIERMAAVEAALDGLPLERRYAPMAADAEVLRCHPQSHLDRIRRAEPVEGIVGLDPDTWMSPGSFEAAMRAVGGTCAAVDLVLAGEASSAFVGCRPPGHHAEREKPMGFCLFGSVAIAARRALDHHGLGRVAVVDFDVHHGNGTQDLLWDEGRALFVSSHQMPLYPGTGAADERGAHGQILNLPLAPGSGSAEMREAWEAAFRRIEDWQPELILISAGFDAHAADPLANLNWREEDFRWLTGRLCDLAAASCGGRVVSTLEGGYDLAALAASSAAHVGVLLERSA
ncbi:histone deacetylase family protein [Cereibacter azotoformans]|uniref:Histone deacetylase superfamily n=1 Tax=Cereibacter sphaeroides (strain ATCC 17025 / ATH 2.4.3) TaxID=349102 RepID=A4WWB2_CERS5|nr:histone deacetylase family protein [Cereibacter azotoformans]ULB11059.1 histone deacetylase family protein [Cereibacter azotoformans]